jgi:ribosomal protein S18 acetylase RimI-like enzyme
VADDELVVVLKRLDDIADLTVDSEVEGRGHGRHFVADARSVQPPALRNAGDGAVRGPTWRRTAEASSSGDDVAGYYWWVDAGAGHPHLERLGIRLGPRDVYGYDFFLAEEHRGGGRAGEAVYGVETALAARGYEGLWGYVRADNLPARWLYSTRGYEETGRVHLKRFRLL